MSRFQDKVVVVTGSSSGIGQALLLAFARQGASVVLHGSDPGRLASTRQLLAGADIPCSRILSIQGDIQSGQVQLEIVSKTVEKFGRIDVLINNAGALSKPGLAPTCPENIAHVMNVNFIAPYNLTHLALPHLVKSGGNVINTSSISSSVKSFEHPAGPIYGASKAALDTWVKYEAQALIQKGVRINNINPGPFDTNILANSTSDSPESVKKGQQTLASSSPYKRFGAMDELTPAYLLMADNESSAFTTGSCWVIDGAMSYYRNDSIA